jgi:glycerate 2-kinase
MRILVAPDKFKNSLGAAEVAAEIATGLRESLPDAEIVQLPISDGGEGTASVICAAAGGEWHSCQVHDPLGRIVRARYCTIADGATAVVEMSEASGLWRVPREERDPTAANSFGTGEMLLDAARRGAGKIIVGLGGSATNDAGFGLARALGFRFLDEQRNDIKRVSELLLLDRIERPDNLRLARITAAADVRNPLLGERGASRVFGPQKGAGPDQVELLERVLGRLADVVARDLGADFRHVPGAGAAGGLGFGLMSFCLAEVRPGFEVVAEHIALEEAVERADVIITGEGRLDFQTLEGKAPAGVAQLARKHGKRIHAIAGSTESNPELRALFDSVTVLARSPLRVDEAMARCAELLRARARELARQL